MQDQDRSFTPSKAFMDGLKPGASKLKNKIISDLINSAKQLERAEIGIDRFRFVCREIEKALVNWGLRDSTSCKKGCSYCCFQQVTITRSEALTLAGHVKMMNHFKRHQIITILQRQSEAKDEKEWVDLPPYYKKCAFLENNLCSIYSFRPITCRTFFVVSPPEICKPRENSKTPPKHALQSYSSMAEYIHTAFTGCEGEGYYEGTRRVLKSIPQAILIELGLA